MQINFWLAVYYNPHCMFQYEANKIQSLGEQARQLESKIGILEETVDSLNTDLAGMKKEGTYHILCYKQIRRTKKIKVILEFAQL